MDVGPQAQGISGGFFNHSKNSIMGADEKMVGRRSVRVTASTQIPRAASTITPSPFMAMSLTPFSIGVERREESSTPL